MGWNLRRSKKVGPFRINLSKSGIGISAGVKGLRAGVDAKGRRYSALSIPGTGLYKRTYYSNVKVDGPEARASKSNVATKDEASNALAGLTLLIAIFCVIFGHWMIGILIFLGLIFSIVIAQLPRKAATAAPTESTTKDLRNVGNIPQETLDYLASKKFKF